MQNTKDTFYEVLRGRLAALHPERTIVVRGVTRPGLLVDDNELPSQAAETPTLPDCFHLRWRDVTVNAAGAQTTVIQVCEVSYETAGTALNSGTDRGRLLAAMDAELTTMVNPLPRHAPKVNYKALAQGGAAVPDGTNIWWEAVGFAKADDAGSRVRRKATIAVMSVEKAGTP